MDMFYAVYIGAHSLQKTLLKFQDRSAPQRFECHRYLCQESLGGPLEDAHLRQNVDFFHSTARIVQYFPQLGRTPF